MTTKPKVFEVGDRARWRVKEECDSRCPECGFNVHAYGLMLTLEGTIKDISHREKICGECYDNGGKRIVIPGGETHCYGFIPDALDSKRYTGTFLAADELQLIEGGKHGE